MKEYKNKKETYDIDCVSTVTWYVFFVPLVICLIFFVVIMLTGCTYSINLVHSQGMATDVIDENQTAQAKIDPSLQLPTGPIL